MPALEKQEQDLNDIDVIIPTSLLCGITELADVYGINYLQFSCRPYFTNFCIQFEERKINEITSFIADVNTIKQNFSPIINN